MPSMRWSPRSRPPRAAPKRIGFEVIIETAAGIAHVEEIAAASPRLQAMSLGAADFAASMGMQTTGIGGTQENYYMLREGPALLVRSVALGAGRHRRRLPHPWRAAGGWPLRRFLG
jgi:citrate lyase beta subunit